jgi:hypothetical protein
MLPMRRGACLCFQCVKTDLEKPPFASCYRRMHHIEGIDWCLEHDLVLSQVDAPHPFDESPHFWLAQERTTPLHIVSRRPPAEGSVRRFAEIAIELQSRDRPAFCSDLNRAILEIVHRPTGREGGMRAVMDELLLIEKSGWSHPYLAEFRRGVIPFESTRTREPLPGPVYALILAIVCESAADALRIVEDATIRDSLKLSEGRNAAAGVGCGGDEYWYSRGFHEFIENDGNASALLRNHGGARSNFLNRLESAGLTSLRGLDTDPGLMALEKFWDGAPLADVLALTMPEDLERLLRITCAPLVIAMKRVRAQRARRRAAG